MENKEACKNITIVNREIILMLNGLISEGGVTISDNKGEKVINIPKGIFKTKVNEVAKTLLAGPLSKNNKDALSQQVKKINACLDSGTTTFTVDYPGEHLRDEMLHFSIIITPNATGGRRSKTYRTKKGKRKGTRRRQRGHRRS